MSSENKPGTPKIKIGNTRKNSIYWDSVGQAWEEKNPDNLWRQYSDVIHVWWLERAAPNICDKLVLKTDLFDEAFGDGLTAWFEERGGRVVACDLALSTASAAACKKKSLAVAVADVTHLPFSADIFDIVFSDSTLDHFDTENEIQQSLHELFKILRPGGTLLLTMDNPRNPIIWLRNQQPAFWRKMKVVPYKVGVTCSASRQVELLAAAGFDVVSVETIMHSPRVLLVPLCRWLNKRRENRYPTSKGLSWLRFFEKLERLPSNQLTGHFVAVVARKPL